MKKVNKKGKGTASSFLIASIIGISILVIIGSFISSLSNKYSVDSIDYFDSYQSELNNITGTGQTYVGDIDVNQNETNPDVDRFEDISFWKSVKIVGKLPSLLKPLSSGIIKIGADIGIPYQFVILLLLVLSIILIALVIKIFRGFDNV